MKKNDIIIGSIFIFLLGSLLHFTYEISQNNIIVEIFSARNESVFEHTKLILYPIIIWYIIFYLKNKNSIKKNYLFSSMIINILVSIMLIPILYYFYTGIFGKSILIIDLLIFYISGLIGLLIGTKSYKQKINLPWLLYIIIIILLYTLATFYPPNIPFFI